MTQAELKQELAKHLQTHFQVKSQAGSCEAELFDGLQKIALELGQRVAIEGTQLIVAEVQKWVQCRFNSGVSTQSLDTQQQLEAANLINDIKDVALGCAKDNFSVIFTGGIEAFIASVAKCVAGKLLGNLGNIGGGIFKEQATGRCGG